MPMVVQSFAGKLQIHHVRTLVWSGHLILHRTQNRSRTRTQSSYPRSGFPRVSLYDVAGQDQPVAINRIPGRDFFRLYEPPEWEYTKCDASPSPWIANGAPLAACPCPTHPRVYPRPRPRTGVFEPPRLGGISLMQDQRNMRYQCGSRCMLVSLHSLRLVRVD